MAYTDQSEQMMPDPDRRLRIFELLAENAPDGIAVVSPDAFMTYANPALHAMLRYDTSLIGMHVNDVLAVDPDTIEHVMEQVITHGEHQAVLTYRRRDNSTFKGQLSALRITDADGDLWALAGIVRDITEHLEMQAALEVALNQSQSMLQEFVDNMPGVIYVYDLDHRYRLVNRQFLEVWQCEAEQVIGNIDIECMPPEYIDSWHRIDEQILASGQPIELEETTLHEQPSRTFLSIKFPLYHADGTLYAIGGISTDITERKQIEDALRMSTERLRLFESLVEHAPEAISVLTLDGTVEYANPSYQSRYYTDDALEGRKVIGLYQDNPERLQEMLQQARTEGFWSGITIHQSADGQTFPAHVTAFAIRNAAGQPTAVATFVRDLSDEVQQERERIALQTHIIETQRAAIRDLGVPSESDAPRTSHNLSEHLLAQAHQQVLMGREHEQRRIARELHDGAVQQLIGISYRLVEIRQSVNDLGQADPQRSEALNSALEATRWQLLTLVGQVRRLISELRPAGLEELGLAATLTSYVERLRDEGTADIPTIDLRLDDIALPAPHTLCLFRVAQEALRNAIQHAQASHIQVILRREAAGVLLQVSDNGRGFQRPSHLSDFMHTNHFGLVGMRERVVWLGGQIDIQTRPGSGTTIRVQLPLTSERNMPDDVYSF